MLYYLNDEVDNNRKMLKNFNIIEDSTITLLLGLMGGGKRAKVVMSEDFFSNRLRQMHKWLEKHSKQWRNHGPQTTGMSSFSRRCGPSKTSLSSWKSSKAVPSSRRLPTSWIGCPTSRQSRR
ncbi:unnamed protein product [Polarella glacialis]|uniref:Uncharacterized protein n=1 Tax=Polarella glacialis TaxID=89957 RepID=A0A813KWE6_POLGL|nr:unnamed protein product [Polarella glacialis]